MKSLVCEIPLGTAVETISLGHDVADAGVDSVSCRVPCIYRDGVLIPTMEGITSRYRMYPFDIAIKSFDETGSGVISLTPQPFEEAITPQVDLPIYKPPEGDSKEDCDAMEAMLSERPGYSSLLAKFSVATLTAENGRDRYVGIAAMFGEQPNGSESALSYEQDATAFYVGLMRNVTQAKLNKILATRRESAKEAPTKPGVIALAA